MSKQEVLPCVTLTPSCRDAAELAREVGRIVSKAVGAEVIIHAMQLSMGDMYGNDITINWKVGER